jgi:hypothetical protein
MGLGLESSASSLKQAKLPKTPFVGMSDRFKLLPCDTDSMQPLSNTRARLAYSFLLAMGLVWGTTLLGFLALLSGFFGNSPPWHYLGKFLLLSSWLWIGPLLLVVGAYWGLRGRHQKASILSIWIGCFSLTAMVLYQIVSLLHDATDPLVMKPTLGLLTFHIVILLIAVLANATALRLTWKSK